MVQKQRVLFGENRCFFIAILCLAFVPLLPEYCSIPLVLLGLFEASRDARKRGTAIQLSTLGKLILLYVAYMAIGILYSDNKANSLATFAMWTVMFCGYLTVTTVIYSYRRLETALFIMGVAAGIVGLIACVQYLLLSVFHIHASSQLWLPLDEFLYQFFPMDIDLHMADNRPSSTFNNPNILAEYLIMVIPLISYYGFCGPRTKSRLLARVFLFSAIVGAVVSFSRGAYLALLSMLLLLLVSNLKFDRITPFILCIIAAICLIPETVIGRFMSFNIADGSINERFEAWEVAIQVIVQHPLFGLGPGISNFWEYLTSMNITAPHSHNLVLQVLVEGGFIGLFLLTFAGTKLLQNSLSLMNRSTKTQFIGELFVMFIISFVIYGMVDYPFLSPKLVGTFLMVLGFADVVSSFYLSQTMISVTQLFSKVKYQLSPAQLRSHLPNKKK